MSAGASPGIGEGVVVAGSCVRVRDDEGERELLIVEPADADARSGRVSMESPLGRALLGHGAGDRVVVRAPAGGRAVSIVEVRL
jgi:transcription elongation GreA/GreB family factor